MFHVLATRPYPPIWYTIKMFGRKANKKKFKIFQKKAKSKRWGAKWVGGPWKIKKMRRRGMALRRTTTPLFDGRRFPLFCRKLLLWKLYFTYYNLDLLLNARLTRSIESWPLFDKLYIVDQPDRILWNVVQTVRNPELKLLRFFFEKNFFRIFFV